MYMKRHQVTIAKRPVYLKLPYPEFWATWPRRVQSSGWPVTNSILFLLLELKQAGPCREQLRDYAVLTLRSCLSFILALWLYSLPLGPKRYPLSASNMLSSGVCIILNEFYFSPSNVPWLCCTIVDSVLGCELYMCSLVNPIRARFLKNVRGSDPFHTETQPWKYISLFIARNDVKQAFSIASCFFCFCFKPPDSS